MPRPVGIDADGRERLEFIEGDAPAAPYPEWALTDGVLASVAALIARFHGAAGRVRRHRAGVELERRARRSRGGPIVCHNDICLENVVFRDGVAVGLLDFDFSAPGRPVYDLAQFARMCVPIDDEQSAALLGWDGPDKPSRGSAWCATATGSTGPGVTTCSRSSTTPWRTAGSSSSASGRRRAGLRHDVGVDGRPGTLGPPPALVAADVAAAR